jgi:hypothetical protein
MYCRGKEMIAKLKKAFLMVAGEFKNTDQTDAPTVINGSF